MDMDKTSTLKMKDAHQSKSKIFVDLPILLPGPSDGKPSVPSVENQYLQCSKEFSASKSLKGDIRMHNEKKVMAKPDKEPAVLLEGSANAGDHGPAKGSAVGGHMTFYQHASKKPKTTLSPAPIVGDLPLSLLGSSEKPSLPCLGNMSMSSVKKVVAKSDEEPYELTEASTNANVDLDHNSKKAKMNSCPNCRKEFVRREALGGHRSRGRCHPHGTALKANNDVEGSEKLPSGVSLEEKKEYYCRNCGVCFPTFQHLGSHRSKCKSLVQSGLEKFYCKHCGRDFLSLKSAASHMGKCKKKGGAHTSARHLLQDHDPKTPPGTSD